MKPILGCFSQAKRVEIEFCGFSIIKYLKIFWTDLVRSVTCHQS